MSCHQRRHTCIRSAVLSAISIAAKPSWQACRSWHAALQISCELKALGAKRIFICATFGLFTDGLEKFDEAWEKKIFHSILTTNLVYQKPELLSKPYYRSCDLSKFVALIIDSLNHDSSLSDLLDPVDRINRFLKRKGAK